MIPPCQRVGRQPHVMHDFLRPCLTREREQGYEDNTLHTGDWEHSYGGTRRRRCTDAAHEAAATRGLLVIETCL